ncbi:ATP-binding protein [Bosea sp. (in: a-proteobacteria)]|jgi:PAS domain S-box-containing protein|uniref:sensor histidine kinase n=1 Tax=Bosea sp. (in: a-proteobacteria) TaxID=1871050 RepID=UPI003F726AB0
MSEAEQKWTILGAEAAKDAALAPYAVDGALLLWDQDAARPGFTNSAAHALLAQARGGLPLPTRERLKLLAAGLAPKDGLRLERLRLTPGFTATLVTCGCKLLAVGDEPPVLAVAIAASELRRLGVATRPIAAAAEPTAISAEPVPASPAAVQDAPATQPKRATVRFLWQSDAAGRLTTVSSDIAEIVGAEAATALSGRNWSDLIGRDLLDRDGNLAARLAEPATWSGHAVLWRTASPTEGVRVELSGVPVLDATRAFAGFRGFGLARMTERERFLDAAVPPTDDAEVAASEAVAEPLPDAATPSAEAPSPERQDAIAPEPPQASQPATEDEPGERPAEAPAARDAGSSGANVVPLRNGHLAAVRPVLEPSKPLLSSAERNAFREIAKALGARIAGDDEAEPEPRLPPASPMRLNSAPDETDAPAPQEPVGKLDEPEADPRETLEDLPPEPAPTEAAEPASVSGRQRLPNSHADVLDRLPMAVLVNRGEEALYANRTLLDLLDYADLADLTSAGGVSRLIKEAARAEGGAMVLIDRTGHLVNVDARLSAVSWQGEPATLMAFRHPNGGGEVKVLTPEEAEDAELAAEFEAEEAEISARVDALRLDIEAREARIGEMIAVLDTATDGVVTVDERGRILSLNKTAEALFGYDQREVAGELFTLLFAPESHAPALDYLEGLKGGGVASVLNDGREVIGRVRQGGRIPLFMTMGQIADGAERRFCAVLRDITAWKKTEGELVEARKAAEKASAQKSDVLAKISHEIRTPLNAIIGFAEVMAEERFGPIGNERYKEYLRDIHQSGGYVISLVNDLLDLAKIEAGKLDLDFVSVNLNEIALSVVNLLQPEAQRGRVVLRSGLSPKLPPVVADQRSIRQIAINLLSNAVKFTDAGGQVIVSTALGDQGEAILRVRDTGIGMDDGEIALALEPFRQVPTTRRSGGTGLGLPLTKALVEANRAAMTITSVKKEGTLVEITFPPQRVLAG